MFEKDEDYRKARKESKDEITKVINFWSAREETLHDKGFENGAEFGYNKANEWHKMDYNDKECYKNIPRYVELLTKYDCGLFVAHCVNKWTGSHWCEHCYGIIAWKEIVLPELKEIKEK